MASTTINPNILTIDVKKDVLEGNQYGHNGIPFLFKIIPTEGKTIKQISSDESYGARATFVDEYESIPYKDARLRATTLKSKRIGTAIELSEEFMNTSVDIETYLKKVFVHRIFDEIERQMTITGTEDGTEPKNIQKLSPWANRTSNTQEGQPLSFEDMVKSYEIFTTNPKNKENAFWLISADAKFSILDENKNERLSFENIPEGADATFLGLPVYRKKIGATKDSTTSEIRGVAHIIANSEAYGISMTNIRFTKVKGDTKQQIRNASVFMAESYVDGKFLNKYAKISAIFAPEVTQASVTEQSIDEPKPVKRKTTKIEKA